MAVSFDTRLITPSHVLTRRLDDEIILLNLDNENYYGLDEVGSHMLEVLSSAQSIEAGVQQLLGEYEVDQDQLRRDVTALLDKLAANGLVAFDPA